MDTFAISVCSGLKMQRVNYGQGAVIALFFGGFQAIMPALGWMLGYAFAVYVDKYDQYIAFALLAFLGGRMIHDAISGGEQVEIAGIDLKSLFAMAFATSIDTLAVGVTFGMDPEVNIVSAALIIGITTFIICMAGVVIGSVFGARWKNRAQIAGGVMLILVGMKILLEVLGLINIRI